ncbi:MAG: hypothetical protein H6605_04405 [Flavobacteriales bacterium]|nr:hypothetical protein [Flavobacteriales bacterium]
MKIIKFIICFTSFFYLSSCKKNDSAQSNDDDRYFQNLTDVMNVQQFAAYEFYDNYILAKDTIDAMIKTGQWVANQPEVESVFFRDLFYFEINFKNGLKSNFSLTFLDKNGISQTRGPARSNRTSSQKTVPFRLMKMSGKAASKKIENTKVLILIPFASEFYFDKYPFLPKFDKAKVPVQVTKIENRDVTLSTLNTLKDYGFILINSHGMINGFYLNPILQSIDISVSSNRQKLTIDYIKEMFLQMNDIPLDQFKNGNLQLDINVSIDQSGQSYAYSSRSLLFVSENYIRTLPKLKDAVVFANECYSGYTSDGPAKNNLSEAFKSIGAISYYGYAFPDGTSSPVDNDFAMEMEDSLLTNLFIRGDSTGIAHLENNTKEMNFSRGAGFYYYVTKISHQATKAEIQQLIAKTKNILHFKHYLEDNYSYGGCGPFVDSRDGQMYNSVCIGKQIWMKENLRFNAPGSGYYQNDTANLRKYGRLYPWNVVMNGSGASTSNPSGVQGICPKGWHVPSPAEFLELMNFTKAGQNGGAHVKDTLNWVNQLPGATNSTGFSALPGGLASKSFDVFYGIGIEADFWTTQENKDLEHGYRYVLYNNKHSWLSASYTKDGALSCRCLKDP